MPSPAISTTSLAQRLRNATNNPATEREVTSVLRQAAAKVTIYSKATGESQTGNLHWTDRDNMAIKVDNTIIVFPRTDIAHWEYELND